MVLESPVVPLTLVFFSEFPFKVTSPGKGALSMRWFEGCQGVLRGHKEVVSRH